MGSKKKNRGKQRKAKQQQKQQEQAVATFPLELQEFAREMIQQSVTTETQNVDAAETGVEVAPKDKAAASISESGAPANNKDKPVVAKAEIISPEPQTVAEPTSNEDEVPTSEATTMVQEVTVEETKPVEEAKEESVAADEPAEEKSAPPPAEPVEETSPPPAESETLEETEKSPEADATETKPSLEKQPSVDEAPPETEKSSAEMEAPEPEQTAGTPTTEPNPPSPEETAVLEPAEENSPVEWENKDEEGTNAEEIAVLEASDEISPTESENKNKDLATPEANGSLDSLQEEITTEPPVAAVEIEAVADPSEEPSQEPELDGEANKSPAIIQEEIVTEPSTAAVASEPSEEPTDEPGLLENAAPSTAPKEMADELVTDTAEEPTESNKSTSEELSALPQEEADELVADIAGKSTSGELSTLPQEEAALTAPAKKKGARPQSFTDFLQTANASISDGNASFTNVTLKPSEYGDAVKKGGDVIKDSESVFSESIPNFCEVHLKQAPPLEKLVIAPRRASYIGVALKPSDHGDAIKSGGDVVKDAESQFTESTTDFSEVHLKKAPPVEKPVIAPRRVSYIGVALKPSDHGDAIKSGGDVVKDSESVFTESTADFSEVHLKQAPPLQKAVIAPRRASYLDVKLTESGQIDVLKAGGDPMKEAQSARASVEPTSPNAVSKVKIPKLGSQEPGKPAFAGLNSTGQANVGWSKICKALVKPANVEVPAKPAYAGFKLKSIGKTDKLMPGADSSKKLENMEAPTEAEETMNAVVDETTTKEPSKPVFAGFKLKRTGKAEALIQKELENARQQAARNPEPVVNDEPAKPSFAGFKLKSTGNIDKIKVGGDVGKQLKAGAGKKSPSRIRPNASNAEAGKPAYAGFKLKSTEQAAEMKAGGDVDKSSTSKAESATVATASGELAKPAYAGFKLKKTSPIEKPKESVAAANEAQVSATKPPLPDSTLDQVASKEVASSEAPGSKPVYAGFKLKSTDQGAAVKSGGDVAKAEEEHISESGTQSFASVQLKTVSKPRGIESSSPREGGTQAFASVQLKKAAPKPSTIDSSPSEAGTAQAFASVQLKKAPPKPSSIESSSREESGTQAFASVQLKKAGPKLSSIGSSSPEKPLYANTKLKVAAPIEKTKFASQGASYTDVHLKATGQSNNLKSGKDIQVSKEAVESEGEVSTPGKESAAESDALLRAGASKLAELVVEAPVAPEV